MENENRVAIISMIIDNENIEPNGTSLPRSRSEYHKRRRGRSRGQDIGFVGKAGQTSGRYIKSGLLPSAGKDRRRNERRIN